MHNYRPLPLWRRPFFDEKKNYFFSLYHIKKSVFLQPQMRDVSPVGLERCLHTAEVTGSSPVRPTKRADITDICSFFHRFLIDLSPLKNPNPTFKTTIWTSFINILSKYVSQGIDLDVFLISCPVKIVSLPKFFISKTL